jgi:hypothetical protein
MGTYLGEIPRVDAANDDGKERWVHDGDSSDEVLQLAMFLAPFEKGSINTLLQSKKDENSTHLVISA